MGMITRKIGRGEYAYLVFREGRKVIHRYIGPTHNPQVMKMIAHKKDASVIPERFKALFWDTSLDRIHIRRNARYIIERVLEFGDIDALEWLQKVYPSQTIIDTLYSSRNISEKSRMFWLLWFGVADA